MKRTIICSIGKKIWRSKNQSIWLDGNFFSDTIANFSPFFFYPIPKYFSKFSICIFFSSGFSSFFFLFSHSLIYFAKFYSLTHLLTKFHNCLETFFFFRLGTLNKQFLFYHIFFLFLSQFVCCFCKSTTLTKL